MKEPVILKPPAPRRAYRWIGLAMLAANRLRRKLKRYDSPRPFSSREVERALDYDYSVVDGWLDCLSAYRGAPVPLNGETILELGPGPDLGVGLLLLEHGARNYVGLDKFPLAKTAPEELYNLLFERLVAQGGALEEVEILQAQLRLARTEKPDRLHYVCRDDFTLPGVERASVDLVFSQAAFEHFEALDPIFAEMTRVARPGATLTAIVDLKTHSRWIRDRDPLNIYRYSDFLYGKMRFPGAPNRLRPHDYEQALRRHGWLRVRMYPLTVLDRTYVAEVAPGLDPRFQDPRCQMEWLSVAICATRK